MATHLKKKQKEIVPSRKPKLHSFSPCQLALNTAQSLLYVFPTDLSVLCAYIMFYSHTFQR